MRKKTIFSVSGILPTTDVPQMNCGVITEQHYANGMEPVEVKAYIDTGCNRSSVSPRLASLLGLEYRGTTTVDSATEKGAEVDLYYGACFVFGNIVVGPRFVTVVDLIDDGDDSKSVDVLLGMDIIGMGCLTIKPAGEKRYQFRFKFDI